jgi:uncharacterized membrane protein YphA (DoxX/SURF4 family)
MDAKLNRLWWTMRIGFGVVFLIVGLDKFFNVLAEWTSYVSERTGELLPVSVDTFMRGVGVLEMAIGAALLLLPRLGGYAASIWMICVAANLVAYQLYDLAGRDLLIALGTYGLARVTEVVHLEQAHAFG